MKTYQVSIVKNGNEELQENRVLPEAPVLKYHQRSSNSCCLSILALSFHINGYNRSATALANCIKKH